MHIRALVAAVAVTALLVVRPARADEPPAATVAAAEVAPGEGKVNINTATVDQLIRLPGIGPTKAGAIAAYRSKHAFARIDDLDHVKGFGRKTMARLRPYLTVNGETTYVPKPRKEAPRAANP